jgi:ribonucleoside-diphosphate reductase beta chain
MAYGVQAMMEGIHSEVYSLMIDTFVKDTDEKDKLFHAIQTIPCVGKKAQWALKWIGDRKSSFATRLIAFACVEGIFFSGSFCAIYWLKQRGLMPGFTTSNEFISRDEGMHTDFACLLYSHIQNRVRRSRVVEIIKEAVDIEKEFICESLPCKLLGMNSELMSQYIEFVADRLCVQLGYSKIFNTTNPFDFMERISLESKDNFFEKRSTNYSKAGVGKRAEEMSFGTDDDF